MSTSYLSQHDFDHDTLAQAGAGTFESQQAALLGLLRGAAGAPVSFADLNAAGIEFPASVVSELELTGVAIERCVLHTNGAREMGVRLAPSCDPHLTLAGDRRVPEELLARRVSPSTAHIRRAFGGPVGMRWLAPVVLFVALGLVTALVLIVLPAGSPAPHARAHARPAKPVLSAAVHVDAPARSASRAQPLTPMSAAFAAQLQASGHELLEAGRYTDAVQTLTRAMTATGERLDDCLEPVSQTCLTYAYALYDLGHALALSGHPAAAVGVLQRRLQIDNQRPIVQNELALARAQAE